MREHIFRGKRLDNGEWAQGHLAAIDLIAPNYLESTENATGTYYGETPLVGFVEVDPATVGECTGLKDKNRTLIFEGDILRYYDTLYPVVFETRNGTAYFGIRIDENETWYFCASVPSSMMTIKGNIHDNPEMIGGTGNGRSIATAIILTAQSADKNPRAEL